MRDRCNGLALHGGFIPYDGTFLVVLRLRAQRAAHGRADEAAHRSTSSRTTRSAWARTARRTSRSSTLRACGSSRTWTSGVRATRSRRRSRGRRRSSARTARRACCFTRQNLPFAAARRRGRSRRSARGGYVLADAAGAARGDHRHRLGSARSRSRRAEAARRRTGIAGARGVDAVHQRVRPPGRRRTATRVLPRGRAARRGRGGRHRLLAQVRRASTARWSASTASANRPRPADLFKHFGFTAENVVEGASGAFAVRFRST